MLAALTPIPCTPAHILGNMNLRGDILTVVDIRRLLSMQAATLTATSTAIIVQVDDTVVGIPAETVLDVIHLKSTDITPVPAALQSGGDRDFLEGMSKYGGHMLSILNMEKIFSEGDLLVDEMV